MFEITVKQENQSLLKASNSPEAHSATRTCSPPARHPDTIGVCCVQPPPPRGRGQETHISSKIYTSPRPKGPEARCTQLSLRRDSRMFRSLGLKSRVLNAHKINMLLVKYETLLFFPSCEIQTGACRVHVSSWGNLGLYVCLFKSYK